MKVSRAMIRFICGTMLALTFLTCASPKGMQAAPPQKDARASDISIDLDQASPVALPKVSQNLKPARFQTADGKTGWVLRIPGDRPIATPAYADGMVFVGGGYGSHEFYAFNAESGDLVWKINTSDDGPTAAVVEDGYVAFNTESCTIIIVDERTGRLLWQEWLGDPLMSQPAIFKGKLFIVYPAGQRNHKAGTVGTHSLLAADLKTGKHLWEQALTADAISAPVISDGAVYVTCFDGTSFAFDAESGKLLWKKAGAATSAPVIAKGQLVVTRKEQQGSSVYEGIARIDAQHGESRDRELLAKEKAGYLDATRGNSVPISKQAQANLDSGVGFSSAPSSANLKSASGNVGVATVAGGWAYQGSRAAYSKGQLLNSQGQYLNSINAESGHATWRAKVKAAKVQGEMQVFSPPALGRDYMYLSSALGHIVSVSQKDGTLGFSYAFGAPMVFQPALANGNVYAGTGQGLLICLKTGNRDADGWYAWGGNAQHNKN